MRTFELGGAWPAEFLRYTLPLVEVQPQLVSIAV